MKKINLSIACVLLVLPLFVSGQTKSEADKMYNEAYFLWEDGKYIPSLEKMISLLEGNSASQYLEKIALTTGEL